jgi:FkbM family methyltransferase
MRRFAKLRAILKVAPYRTALLRHGVAAAVEHESALGSLKLRTVVDVGANRGQFSLFAQRSYPGAKIISLEPLSAPAARFRQVFAGERRVTLHHAALGPTSGQATMYVSGHDDSSSLLPITAAQGRLFPGTETVGNETVRIGPLSEFLRRESIDEPAMLKLDVQGYELEALNACEDLLDRFAYICAEGSFVELYRRQVLAGDLISWLHRRGYALACVYGTVSDELGRAIQADMLFKKEEAAAVTDVL